MEKSQMTHRQSWVARYTVMPVNQRRGYEKKKDLDSGNLF
jgi:hypothetical protein